MTGPPRAPRYPRLVLCSGGIDSTYQLVKMMRETDDIIVVHRVHMINPEGRHGGGQSRRTTALSHVVPA